MTIAELKAENLIIYECISGSRAYGLDTPSSDTDIKGVYILPKDRFYTLDYIPQISNQSNDEVYYELGRYIELLALNNPNIMELLNTPNDSILYKHEFMESITSELFLSKLCKDTFGKFAISQIKKAKGLNKKIVNPISKEKKNILSFCYVTKDGGSVELLQFLSQNGYSQEDCGVLNINHMKNIYALYYGKNLGYKGLIKSEQSDEVMLSSIPKGEKEIAIMYVNHDGFTKYCSDYKNYWEWVELRNEDRYQNTIAHSKNYDAKNMMHTFRLLDMAYEIATQHKVNVKRPNRDFLLDIKSGKFEYDELLELANKKITAIDEAFASSTLQEKPNKQEIANLSYRLREKFYNS